MKRQLLVARYADVFAALRFKLCMHVVIIVLGGMLSAVL